MVLDDVRKSARIDDRHSRRPRRRSSRSATWSPAPRRTRSRRPPATCSRVATAPPGRGPERGLLADQVDGRGDAGRSRRAPQAGARSRAARRDDRVRSEEDAPPGRRRPRSGRRAPETSSSTAAGSSSLVLTGRRGPPPPRRRARASRAGRQPSGGAGSGPGRTGDGAGRAGHQEHDARGCRRGARPAGAGAPLRLPRRREARRRPRRVRGRSHRDVTASTRGRRPAGSPTACCSAAPVTSSRSTSGYGQLAWELRTDPRVTVLDRTNVRELDPATLPYRPSLVTADLSFISLRSVLGPLVAVGGSARRPRPPRQAAVRGRSRRGRAGRRGRGSGRLASRDRGGRRGREPRPAPPAAAVIASPITGPAGNVEFLLHARVGGGSGRPLDVDGAIAAAGELAGA